MTITVRSNGDFGKFVLMQEHKSKGCVVSSLIYLDEIPVTLDVPEGGRLELAVRPNLIEMAEETVRRAKVSVYTEGA